MLILFDELRVHKVCVHWALLFEVYKRIGTSDKFELLHTSKECVPNTDLEKQLDVGEAGPDACIAACNLCRPSQSAEQPAGFFKGNSDSRSCCSN